MTPVIVCGVDRSDRAWGVAAHASWFAERLGLPLVLVHVATWPEVHPQTRSVMDLEWAESEHRRENRRWLQRFASELALACVDVRVEIGSATEWLLATARECTAALIVVGCRGNGPLRTLFEGSVSADMVRLAPCPVLVVPPGVGDDGAPLAGERIVCGVRGMKDAGPARLAARLAAATRLRLTLAHVVDRDVEGPELIPPPDDAATEIHVLRGAPSTQLRVLAEAQEAALIVVGSRRRGPLRSGVLGSVSRSLAATADRAVLVCPSGAL